MIKKIALLISAFLLALTGLTAVSSTATAATDAQCINSRANLQGATANQCRQAGWTINSYIVVDPGKWVRWGDWYYFNQCNAEYGGPIYPCSWNFGAPPSAGSKYYFDNGRHQIFVNGLR